jgi:hypothetical protein
MTFFHANQPEKIYFYAPDKMTHNYFRQHRREEIVKFGNTLLINWIASTFIELKKAGLPCEVIDYMPKQGIVIADRDTLGNQYPYLGSTMLVCAKCDREFHPSAHLHVVQNPIDTQNPYQSMWNPHYIPHWPQPYLQARNKARGSTVKNVAFMGTRSNLTEEFKSDRWISALEEIGCQWTPIFSPAQWSDYSEVDVIVAVRSFDGRTYPYKPASKLINAWKAGVPAILTPESAFVGLRKSDLDFLSIHSIEDAIDAVVKLKTNPELYASIINNGLTRAQEASDEKIIEDWLTFVEHHVFPEYAKWHEASEVSKIILFGKRYFRLKIDRMKNRIFGPDR